MSPPKTNHQAYTRKLLYRSNHRGTKEMDWMLGKYAESFLDSWSDSMRKGFEELLDVSDVVLYDAIMLGLGTFSNPIQHHLEKIREHFGIDKT